MHADVRGASLPHRRGVERRRLGTTSSGGESILTVFAIGSVRRMSCVGLNVACAGVDGGDLSGWQATVVASWLCWLI